MELIEYKKLYEREKFFWWNVGRRRILEEALARHTALRSAHILDVGCGPGGNILFLKRFGNVTGLDSSPEALSFAQTQGFSRTVQGMTESSPFGNKVFDIVSALDVIEHVDKDEQALEEIFRILKDGGLLLLSVPAYPWMWSSHDVLLHHKRRYTKAELMRKVRRAGFEILETSYFVTLAVPFRAIKWFWGKVRRTLGAHDAVLKTDDVIVPPFLNTLLLKVLLGESVLMRFISIPFGSSLLVVAKKI